MGKRSEPDQTLTKMPSLRAMTMRSKDSHKGSDNVLTDLGFDDAEELSAKAVLAVKLNELIGQRGLSQTQAAGITGMTQPKLKFLPLKAEFLLSNSRK